MKVINQKQKLNIESFDLKPVDNRRRHSGLLPNQIRCLITGPSSCGKTAVMLSLITDPNGLKFENIYVYSKSLYQPKYQFLENVLKNVKGIGYYKFSENEEVIQPSEAKKHSVFVFDDIICDKQNNVSAFFSMGRHKDVDCFYLCQSYSRIPKQLIRDNANMIIVFKQDNNNLKHVYNNHINPDLTFTEFVDMCQICWNKKFGFFVIDKESDLNNGRYRNGFDKFFIR